MHDAIRAVFRASVSAVPARHAQSSSAVRVACLAAVALAIAVGSETVPAAWPYPPRLTGTRVEVYKTVGDTRLALWIFEPTRGADARRPAIVFFFGGGWAAGSPQQFEPQCRQLADRGMVAITADYRVASRHGAKPVDCVADGRSAIRWVRAHADRLGIDPARIAAAGGSAGGHVAACTAFIDEFDAPDEDRGTSAVPDALVLFNPVLVLAPLPGFVPKGFGVGVPAARLGSEPQRLSPAHHVRAGGPPAIIFHGRADDVVPYAAAEVFSAAMRAAGNRCELVGCDDQPHGFFNKEPWRTRTLAQADAFLTSLGWLAAESPPPQD